MGLTKTQQALAIMTTAFGGKFTDKQAAVYARFLRDLDDSLVSLAIEKILLTAKFPPTIAEIRDEVKRLKIAAAGDETLTADKAWFIVQKAVRRYGVYGKPLPGGGYEEVKFDDANCQRAVDYFGWDELCKMPIDKVEIYRKHFTDIYARVEKEAAAIEQGNALLNGGVLQIANRKRF